MVEVLDGPWRTEPHAPQRWGVHIELDADAFPGGFTERLSNGR